MADLMGKLGQQIKGSVGNFGAGLKSAAMSGNPALFGALAKGIEKGFDNLGDELKKDREDRKKEKQFDEEKAKEQFKLFSDIEKSLKGIKDALEKMLGFGGKGSAKPEFSNFEKALIALGAALASLEGQIGNLIKALSAFKIGGTPGGPLGGILKFVGDIGKLFSGAFRDLLTKFKDLPGFLNDLFKSLSGLFRDLVGKLRGSQLGKLVDELITGFSNFFRDIFGKLKGTQLGKFVEELLGSVKGFFSNIFEKFKGASIGGFVDDMLKSVRGFFTNIFSKFKGDTGIGSFIDDALKTMRGFFSDTFGRIFTRLKNFFDVEIDFFKNLDIKGTINSSIKKIIGVGEDIIKFFGEIGDEIAKLPGFGKLVAMGGKVVRAIPIIGNLIMVLDGIFTAFDTEFLAETLGIAQKNVNWEVRLIGFFGGILGSIFGIFDLIALGMKSLFNIDMTFADGESFQKKATRFITGFIYDFFSYMSGLFKFIGGLLTLDSKTMKEGLVDMELIVEDWLIGFKNFFGSILKVPFAKMTNAVAGAIEYMVNGVVDAMNAFVGFIIDGLAKLPGISKEWAEKTKKNIAVDKIKVGRMDETPYKSQTSRRAEQRRATVEADKKERAKEKDTTGTSSGTDSSTTGSVAPSSLDQLTEDQRRIGRSIYDKFIAAGFSDAQAIGAVANAFAESGFNPRATNINAKESSIGLFQLNQMGGLGQGYNTAYLQNPDNNIAIAIAAANKSRAFLNAKTAEEAARAFSLEVEKPKGGVGEAQRRANLVKSIERAIITKKVSSSSVMSPSSAMAYAGDDDLYMAFPNIYDTKWTGENSVIGYGAQRRGPSSGSYNNVVASNQYNEVAAWRDYQSRGADAMIQLAGDSRQYYTYYRDETERDRRFKQERAGLENQFYETMRSMYRDYLRDVVGPMRMYQKDAQGNIIGGGYVAAQGLLNQPLQDLGKKIFGERYGGAFGNIFTRLAGSYIEQFAGSAVGSILGVDNNAVQKGLYKLAQGDKKGFVEELVFGKTGIPLNMEQAIGGVEGMEQLAKDLAEITGTPFSPLFNFGNQQNNLVEQGRDPFSGFRVTVQDSGEMFYRYADAAGQALAMGGATAGAELIERVRSESGASGTMIRDAQGRIISEGRRSGTLVPPGTAASRIGDRVVNMGTAYIANKVGSLAGNNPYARMALGSATAGGVKALLTGGDMMQGVGKGLGFNISEGLNMFQGFQAMYEAFSGGLVNAAAKITAGVGDMAVKMMQSNSSFLQSTGNFILRNEAVIGKLADVGVGYMAGSTINTMISGGKSMGGTMDTIQQVGIAAASFFFGPIGGAIAGAIGGLLNAAFGHGPTEVKDYGLTGQLGTDTSAQTYVQKHQEGGWFSSDNNWTEYSGADAKTIKALNTAITNIQGAVKTSARMFRFQDVDATEMGGLGRTSGFFRNFVGPLSPGEQALRSNLNYKESYEKMLQSEGFKYQFTVSTMGKSPEEQQQILENLLKDYTDAFIRNSFGTALDRFQKAGERLSETFDRLANASDKFNDIALKLGFTFQNLVKTTDLLEIAAFKDNFIEIYGGMEKFVKNSTFYFENFYTEEERLQNLKLLGEKKMREAIIDAGLEAKYQVSDLVGMAGTNFEEARKKLRTMVDEFTTKNADALAGLLGPDAQKAAIKELAFLQGDLAQSYFVTAKAAEELNKKMTMSAEALKTKWAQLFGRTYTPASGTGTPSQGGVITGNYSVVSGTNASQLSDTSSGAAVNNQVLNNMNNGNTSVVDNSQKTTVINQNVSATDGSSNRVVSPTNVTLSVV